MQQSNSANQTEEASCSSRSGVEKKKKTNVTLWVVYLIGFSDGLTHLAALAIYYLFKDDLALTPSEVSGIFVAPTIPWIIKPLFAFCSDSYPLFGYRRKSYLVLFSLLEAIGFLFLGFSAIPGVLGATMCLFLISTSAAFCSCVADALVVQGCAGKSKSATAKSVADFIGSKALGSLFVAFFSGYLLEKTSKQNVISVTSVFPLMLAVAAPFIQEDSNSFSRSMPLQINSIVQYIRNPVIWGPALFIFVYTVGPDYDDVIFFFLTNKLGFSPTFMGTLRLTYGIAAIMGILIYKFFLQSTSYKKILLFSILLSFPIYISPIAIVSGLSRKLGISNKLFVLSGGFLIEATSEIQMLPLLVLIACSCPVGLEASVYGILMSVRNAGTALSRGLSGLLAYSMGITAKNFSGLAAFVLICGLFMLLPIPLLVLIPDEKEKTKMETDSTSRDVLLHESVSNRIVEP